MIVAIDTGGTKTLIECFDADGMKTFVDKFPTPLATDEYVDQVATVVSQLNAVDAIVVAMPGIVEDGVISFMGNLPWRNFDVQTALKKRLPDVPIFIENDANLGGVGEVRSRDSAPSRCLYLTVSTGIGGGFIVDGHIDPFLATTEVGHMRLEFDGKLQRWEHFASGKAITKVWGKMASEITRASDWEAIALRVSRGLLALLPSLRPELIIIGGGVGTHYEKFSHPLQKILERNLEPLYLCPIERAAYPEEAVIYGCYYYAIDALAR